MSPHIHIASRLMAMQVPTNLPYAPASPPVTSTWQQVESALTLSLHRLLIMLARFLPGLLAVVIAVALFTGIGFFVAWLLRKFLAAVRFDERLAQNRSSSVVPNLQDFSPAHSPTALVARTAFWACVVLGCVIGITAFDAFYSETSQLAVFLLPYLTHVVGAILLLLAGNLIARFLARSVLIGAVNQQFQYARLLSQGVKWLVLVLTAAMVLDHLQIGGAIVELAFGILFGGIVLTLSLAIGLGSREIVSRSLERKADAAAMEDYAPPPTTTTSGESLRHF